MKRRFQYYSWFNGFLRISALLISLIAIINSFIPGVAFAAPMPTTALFLPVAGVSLDAPDSVFLGNQFTFTVEFDNTSADPNDVGYGPFIDLVMPASGVDGDDGISLNESSPPTYLGAGLNYTIQTFPDNGTGQGTVDHPLLVDSSHTPLQVTGQAGDQLVTIELPFGSITNTFPMINVTVNAVMSGDADLGTDLTIAARGGFQFGADPLDNACCDAPIVNPDNDPPAGWATDSVSPALISISKDYNGPDGGEGDAETATGPNFTRQYTIQADIADGQTITDFILRDLLPPNMEYVQLVSLSPSATCSVDASDPTYNNLAYLPDEPETPGAQVAPDNDLTVVCTSVNGSDDFELVYEFFIPEDDANGDPVINADSGAQVTSLNHADILLGSWDPSDVRDDPVDIVAVGACIGCPTGHTLTDQSLAVQKSVVIAADVGASGASPGDILQYTLTFQVSDYFRFDQLLVTDVISDGQHFVDATTPNAQNPTLDLSDHDTSIVAHVFTYANNIYSGSDIVPDEPVAPDDMIVDLTEIGNSGTPGDGTDGSTTLEFFVYIAMSNASAPDEIIEGGSISGTGTPAIGTITFYTQIQEDFTDDYPSGDPSVDHGDHLANSVTIRGRVVESANPGTEYFVTDTSSAGVTIVRDELIKTIYAINGNPPPDPVNIKPGDTITFRLRYPLPSSDFEDLTLTDYLPLPVLIADDSNADGVTGDSWWFDTTVSAAAPPSGWAKFGPDETLSVTAPTPGPYTYTPTISVDENANSLSFDIGTFDDDANTSTQIDILFTYTVTNEPFADGLKLTNLAQVYEGSTNAGDQTGEDIIQFTLYEPVLLLRKGTTDSDNPDETFSTTPRVPAGWTPGAGQHVDSNDLSDPDLFNADIDLVDGRDIVSFAIVIENQGHSSKGAYDIRITDVMPAGLRIPNGNLAELNLQIYRGDGLAITHTNLGSSGTDADLFDAGIELNDPVDPSVGICQTYEPASGTNVIVITYDLEIDPNAEPGMIIANQAELINYAGEEGGTDHTGDVPNSGYQDGADVGIAMPQIEKSITGTNQTFTDGNNVVIGEMIQYQAVITVPEGRSSEVTFVDTLDAGLAFVSFESISVTSTAVTAQLVINEVDADTSGATDTAEFIELYDGGSGNTALDGYSLVLYDGSNDQVYAAFDLDTFSTDGSGYFIIGNTAVAPDLIIPDNTLLNSAAAVALYQGDAVDYPPGTALTTVNLLDALVYDTGQADDAQLLTLLNMNEAQVNEAAGSAVETESNQRCTTGFGGRRNTFAYIQAAATPGAASNSDSCSRDTGVLVTDQGTFAEVFDAPVITPVGSGTTAAGRRVTFDFGNVYNFDTDNTTDETIILDYTVVVLNTVNNQQDQLRNNQAAWHWNGEDVQATADNVTIHEPSLNIAKSASTNSADAGDTVTYTLTVTYDGSVETAAFEVELIDVIPTGMTYVNASLDCNVTGTTFVPDSCTESGGQITAVWDTRAYESADTTIITFDVTVDVSVLPGQELDNVPTVSWTSLPGNVSEAQSSNNPNSDERNGADGVGGELDDYIDSTTETVIIHTSAPEKTIVDTSEAFTGLGGDSVERVAIGEIVRYHLAIRIPESTIPDFRIRDNIPTGMQFLNDGTAKIALVYDMDPITSNIHEDADWFGTSSDITPTYVLLDSAVTSNPSTGADAYSDGADVYFLLGDVVNNDRDNEDNEYVVIEFNALVLNVNSNQAYDQSTGAQTPTMLANSFDLFTGTTDMNDTSTSAPVRIAEPLITVIKTETTATPVEDAGDTVRYQLVIANNGAGTDLTDAFNIVVTDVFDPYLILADENTDIIVNTSYTTVEPVVDVSASNDGGGGDDQLNATISQLEPGASVTFDITLTLEDDTPMGYELDNAATATYTSLAGTNGSTSNSTGSDTPGTAGSTTGERTGDDSAGSQNDFRGTSGTVRINLTDPAVTKITTATSESSQGAGTIQPDLVIGETVTFQIEVVLPEGFASPLVVTDQLPLTPGRLGYVSHNVLPIGAQIQDGSGNTPVAVVTTDDTNLDTIHDQVIFNFGDVYNVPDGSSDPPDAIVLEIVALVLNHVDNQQGDVLINTATVQAGSYNYSDTTDVEIVEPVLTLSKAATVTSPASGISTYGARLEYVLTLTNTSSSALADAWNIVVTDTIPVGMTYVPGSISSLPSWNSVDAAAPTLVWTAQPGTQLAPGAALEFSYAVIIDSPPAPSAADPGDVLTNDADATWTSLETRTGGERDGSDGSGGLNDYITETSTDVTVGNIDLRIVKDDGGASIAAGSTLVYTLHLYNDGNINATDVRVTDTVPEHTTFDQAGSSATWSCVDNAPAGSVCTHTPNVGAGAGVLEPGGPYDIYFAVTVDLPLPADVTEITNTASIEDLDDTGPDPTPENNESTVVTGSVAAAPDLTIVKDDHIEIVAPGAHLTYQLVYQNVGSQDATGAVITETVSTGTTFDAAASTSGWVLAGTGDAVPDGAAAGTVCEYPVGALNVAEGSATVDFAVVVDNPLAPGITEITNTASIADDGNNGSDLNSDNNSSTDTDQVARTLIKTLLSTSHAGSTTPQVAIGEILDYQVQLVIPSGSMATVTLIDDLDLGLTFMACTSITPQSSDLTTDLSGGFDAACDNAVAPPGDPTSGNPALYPLPLADTGAANQARRIHFNLGNITNDASGNETLTIVYRVVVLDNSANLRGLNLNNNVTWSWGSVNQLSAGASAVTLIEPDLTLEKTVDNTVALRGSVLTYTLRVAHAAGSDAHAYEARITDIVPDELIYVSGSLASVSGPAPDDIDDSAAPTLTIQWDTFPTGAVAEISFQAEVRTVSPGTRIVNRANLEWTSLPGDVSAPQSDFNTLSTERYYDPASPVNVYGVSAEVTVQVPSLPDTGFAPNRLTTLPEQPQHALYRDLGDLWLEIPSLGVNIPIVGIPTDENGWDLTWLWDQAGFLSGTAFPTFSGNTGLTGHVYLPDGTPGPFVNLHELGWKDEVIIHAYGNRYYYMITQTHRVYPNAIGLIDHREYDWITLVTCQGFDEARDTYRYRIVVQGVLMKVEAEE